MRWLALAGLALCVIDGRAGAESNTPSIDVVPPWVQAIVPGASPGTKPSDYTLHDSETVIEAEEIRDAPIAIAIVYQGSEVWLGNDELIPPDDPSRYAGALKDLQIAIDQSGLAAAGPAGSKIVLVKYSSGTALQLAASDLSTLRGQALGKQTDYRNMIGSDLVAGITLGLDQLATLHMARKALIVIGDGNDTDADRARTLLKELADRAHTERVDTYAIVWKTALSEISNGIDKLVATPAIAQAPTSLPSLVKSVVGRLAARAVVFDGRDLDWNGQKHHLSVSLGGDQLVSGTIILPLRDAESGPWAAWWRWAVIAAGVVAIGVLAFVMRSRLRTQV